MLYTVVCSQLRTGQLINAIYLYFPSTEAFLYTMYAWSLFCSYSQHPRFRLQITKSS